MIISHYVVAQTTDNVMTYPAKISEPNPYNVKQFNLVSGLPDGKYRAKGENGIFCQMEYTESLVNGNIVIFNSDSIPIWKIQYVSGKKNGVWQKYDSNGKLLVKMQYVEGRLNGFVEMYSSSEVLIWQTTYKNDKKEGAFRGWYENGNKRWDGNYTNEMLNGDFRNYDESGKLIEELYYKEGNVKRKTQLK